MTIHLFLPAVGWLIGRMAFVFLALLPNIGFGSEPAVVAPADEPKQAEVARFRPYISLDHETGRLTYAITNVSDQALDVDLETITGKSGGHREDSVGGIFTLYDIVLDGEAYDWIEEAPDGRPELSSEEADRFSEQSDVLTAQMHKLAAKYTPKFRGWTPEPHGSQKRVVTLRPGEGLSRTLVLQDQPWYEEVVKMLEATGFTKYRITPHASVYVVDDVGIRHWDPPSSTVYSGPIYLPIDSGNDFRICRYPVPGATFDLEVAKKLQTMKTKAAVSQPTEPGRQGGNETAPAPHE